MYWKKKFRINEKFSLFLNDKKKIIEYDSLEPLKLV